MRAAAFVVWVSLLAVVISLSIATIHYELTHSPGERAAIYRELHR